MKRYASAAGDRLGVLLIGILLLAACVVSWLWYLMPVEGELWEPLQVVNRWWGQAADAGLWTIIVASAGVICLLWGLAWLIRLFPSSHVGKVRLGGSGVHGRFEVDLNVIAQQAADSLTDDLGIAQARGRAINDRGRRTIVLKADIDGSADVDQVRVSGQRVAGEVLNAVGDIAAVQVLVVGTEAETDSGKPRRVV